MYEAIHMPSISKKILKLYPSPQASDETIVIKLMLKYNLRWEH